MSSTKTMAAPPSAPVGNVVDNYHGTTIADPYRYMEHFKDPAVQAWVQGQADYAEQTLHSLPGREAILERIAELDAGSPYSLYGITRRANGDLFYFKQLAIENVAKVYFYDGATATERLLIDPETFPKQDPQDHSTLSFYRVSPDGSHLLYGFAASGSEQTTLRVFDLATNRDLPDAIDRLESEYAPPYWLPDGKSFVFSRRRKIAPDASQAEAYKFTQAFWHTIGGDPEQGPVVFGKGAPGSPPMGEMDFPAVIVPVGSNWVVGQIRHGDETDVTLYAAPLTRIIHRPLAWSRRFSDGDKLARSARRPPYPRSVGCCVCVQEAAR